MRHLFLLLFFICSCNIASAMQKEVHKVKLSPHSTSKASSAESMDEAMEIGLLIIENARDSASAVEQKILSKKKAVAITLAVTLGVFGAHRLYLGTSTKIPIIYTLTLGGGFGVLMVADIIAIIATKDLTPYSPNPKIFMWAQ